MRKFLFISLIINFKTLAQSVELTPGSNGFVMIPNVSTLGTCSNADKGKIVYYGTDNSLRMCNGSTWVNISNSSGFSLPFAAATTDTGNPQFVISNSNTSNDQPVLLGISNSSNTGDGIKGVADNFSPTGNTKGVSAINNALNANGFGLYSYHYGTGTAAYGESPAGTGISGRSESGVGVKGFVISGTAGQFISAANGNALIALGGKVGIGTSTPTKAFMVVDGKMGATHAIFGETTSGVAIESNWPAISFNSYWNNGRKPLTDGFIGGFFLNPSNGYMAIYNSTASSTAGVNASPKDVLSIMSNGFTGIGVTNPASQLDVNGRARIRYTSGNTAGIWMNNSLNGLGNADGSFWGNKSDTEAGIYIGNNWRFWVNNFGQVTSSALAGSGNRPVLTNASGTLTADNINHSLVLSPADFQPAFSANQFYTNTSWAYFTETGGIYSAIHLPGGAVITDISVVGKDNSSTARLCLSVSKSEATSDNSLYIGCSTLAGFSSELTNLSLSPSITPFVIEEDEFYQVYVSAQNNSGLNVSWNNGNNFQFRLVKITYHY